MDDSTVTIKLAIVKRCQYSRPELWNDLWAVGRLRGVEYETSRENFEALCAKHAGPFAPGEVVHKMARPVKKIAKALGVKFSKCGCDGRRFALNL
jgi:hypothetical protein